MTNDFNISNTIEIPPGVSSAYGNGWKQLWKHFWELLLAGIIVIAISQGITWSLTASLSFGMADMLDTMTDPLATPDAGFFGALAGYYAVTIGVQLFIVAHLYVGMAFLFLSAARGDKVKIGDLFSVFSNYWSVVMANLVLGLAYGVSGIIAVFAAVFIPFLGWLVLLAWIGAVTIAGCKLAFVPFLLVDKKMKAMEAIKTSWKWTNGHAGNIFLIGLLAVPISIAGFICLFVGVIPAIMWVYMAYASMYHAVSSRKDAPVASPSPIIQ